MLSEKISKQEISKRTLFSRYIYPTISGSDEDVKDVSINLLSDSGSQVKTINADNEGDGTWVGEFDLSSVPDGNYNVTAVATDTAKNVKDASSAITVNVDKTAPVIENYSPADGKVFAEGTTAVDISFDYSDARTGINESSVGMIVDNIDVTNNATINASSASYNGTGLAVGSHAASIFIADNTGNNKKFTTNFWIGPKPSATTSSSSGSSSGGGGGGSTGEKYENIRVKEVESIYVTKDSRINYEFNKDGNAITSVHFDALRNAGTISTIIEVLKDRSTFAKTDVPGNVYQQMNIWVGKSGFVDPENVENLGIGFMVEKTWLEENNIESDTVKLYRYSNESWTALDTEVTEEDDEYVYFESQTPAFSPFAISSEAESEELTDEAILQSVDDESVISDGEPIEVKTTSSESSTFVFVILGGLSVVLIGAYLIYRKGK
ncbi:PGF-pre-PGF domain-containing protein [Methanolobus zinderi]|uniref:PGF-pre-PGF domain-containing protein n=1 Tax=Methanolobus zinderi TaxID=536044 RepID=A0A7D5E7V7_9EURY|nr:PGF-pre-PGF domain-containing protein [Methanolobus zinderi]QLC49751.1 PGF-pre-PGF domain-containing protein [Methanolobus zinderi]